MLQAILHGKLTRLAEVLPDSRGPDSLRARYRETEDFCTASVFGRLTYLPAGLFWKMLRDAMGAPRELPEDAGELADASSGLAGI